MRNCGIANETPATSIAGHIAEHAAQAGERGRSARTARCTENTASCAADHRAELQQVEIRHALQRDDRRAERAERDGRRVGDERQSGRLRAAESPDRSESPPVTATGVPKPAAPSKNAPKQNATSSSCSRRSRVTRVMLCAKHAEEAALVRQSIEKDDVEHDPADRKQAVDARRRRPPCPPSSRACRR